MPWMPSQPSTQSQPTHTTLSPPTTSYQQSTYGGPQIQSVYNAPPIYQYPPLQQNVQIIERIVERPVEKIVYVDRYIQSPPPPVSNYPSPPPSFINPPYAEAPMLLPQDQQVRTCAPLRRACKCLMPSTLQPISSTSTWREVDIIASRQSSPLKPPKLLQRQMLSQEFDPRDFLVSFSVPDRYMSRRRRSPTEKVTKSVEQVPEPEPEPATFQKTAPARAVRVCRLFNSSFLGMPTL